MCYNFMRGGNMRLIKKMLATAAMVSAVGTIACVGINTEAETIYYRSRKEKDEIISASGYNQANEAHKEIQISHLRDKYSSGKIDKETFEQEIKKVELLDLDIDDYIENNSSLEVYEHYLEAEKNVTKNKTRANISNFGFIAGIMTCGGAILGMKKMSDAEHGC